MKLADRDANCDQVRSDIELLQARHQEWHSKFGLANHLDSCRLGPEALQGLIDVYSNLDRGTVHMLQHGAMTSPSIPSEEEQQLLLQGAESFHPPKQVVPWWARHFILNRNLFRGTAICNQADPSEAWLFLIALQSPHWAVFLHLVRRPRVVLSGEPCDVGQHAGQPMHRSEFDVLPCRMADQATVPIDEDGDLYVLSDMRFAGQVVSCNHLPEPFEHFVQHHPPLDAQRAASKSRRVQAVRPRNDREMLRKEFPWLTEEDLDKACGLGRASRGPRKKGSKRLREDEDSTDSSESVVAAVSDVDMDVIMERLAGIRAEYADSDVEEEGAFVLKILGGKWTAAHVGKVADRVAANSSGMAAKTWCDLYNWPKTTSFSFSRYSEAGAVVLARQVVRRGNYFYRVWLNADPDLFRYSDADLAGYPEDVEWLDWMIAQELESISFKRGTEVRSMLPKAIF